MKRIIYFLVFAPFLVHGQSLLQGSSLGSQQPALIAWGGGDQVDYSARSFNYPIVNVGTNERYNHNLLNHSFNYESGLNNGKVGILVGGGQSFIKSEDFQSHFLRLGATRYFEVNDFVFSGGALFGRAWNTISRSGTPFKNSSLSLSGAVQYKKFVLSNTYITSTFATVQNQNYNYESLNSFLGYEF